VDIGANHGLVTLILAKQNPKSKIFCFEPNSRLYDIILTNIRDNNLTNVVAYNKAVNTNKTLFLIENSEVSGASTLGYDKNQMQNFYKNSQVKEVQVECISIDEFITEEKIENIHLLKIDCEGSEFDILTKSKLLFDEVKIENIVGEFHDLSYYYDKEMSSNDLLEICRKKIEGIVNVSILKI
jgi:FkbM family methyltransferase